MILEPLVSTGLTSLSRPAQHLRQPSSRQLSSRQAVSRHILLGGGSILAALLLCSPRPAIAACSNTSPVTGETVNCTGTSTTPITANAAQNGITINLQNGAQLNSGGTRAIDLGGSAQINLLGNSQINADQSLDVFVVGDNSGLALSNTSSINATGFNGFGARFDGNNDIITLRDGASINAAGANGDGI
jgi:hypothetical protein